ncbi:MAG: hypothetical protein AAB425_13470, partial [Bdellovibrionota bacterium]
HLADGELGKALLPALAHFQNYALFSVRNETETVSASDGTSREYPKFRFKLAVRQAGAALLDNANGRRSQDPSWAAEEREAIWVKWNDFLRDAPPASDWLLENQKIVIP